MSQQTYRDFDDFLASKHAEQYHGLDDEMPDDFSDWCSNLDIGDLIKYADEYANAVSRQLADLLHRNVLMVDLFHLGDNPNKQIAHHGCTTCADIQSAKRALIARGVTEGLV